MHLRTHVPFALLSLLLLPVLAQEVTFAIDATKGNATSFAISTFVENNVNRADDGGLYAELVQNRAFQEQDNYLTLTGWKTVQSASSMAFQKDTETPLGAIKQSLQVFIPKNASAHGAQVGLNNTGWWGIPVLAQPHSFSMFVKSAPHSSTAIPPFAGSIHVSLYSLTSNTTLASHTFTPSAASISSWTQLTATLTPSAAAPDGNNVLSILFDVQPTVDNNIWINLVSLFPPTWNNRPNGLRKDLAVALADLKPKLVRIPGGSDLQGSTIANRYNWSNTIGPLQDRPGRVGYWVGWQTEGLGLMEELDMIEDMNATAVLGVYDGYAANDESIPNTSQLDKFIQDAVNELQFVLGDPTKNSFAKMRADLGHPLPYKVTHIEIGNEDFTSETYSYRWSRFHTALSQQFPNLTYIATATIPGGVSLPVVDLHDYSGPDFFYAKFNKYDNWPRNNTKIIELEGAVISTDSVNTFSDPAQRFNWTEMIGSVAEAVVAIGLQRNGDLVIGSSYAPNLANINAQQWTPNLITYNSTNMVLSTSYYVQQMISLARSDMTHPVNTSTPISPLFWVASSLSTPVPTFFIQIANINATTFPFSGSITLPASASSFSKGVNATITTMSASQSQGYFVSNTMDEPFNVVPQTTSVSATMAGGKVSWSGVNIPGWSFSVLKFVLE